MITSSFYYLEGNPHYRRQVEDYEVCENLEDEPILAVNILSDLKAALENGKGAGKGMLPQGSIDDLTATMEEVGRYLEGLENGESELFGKQAETVLKKLNAIEKKVMPMFMEQMEMDEDSKPEDHMDHDDEDKDKPKPDSKPPKDEDNEVKQKKQALEEEDIIEK